MTLLTAKQIVRERNYFLQRDGIDCLYCAKKLDFEDTTNPVEIDHLDNNPHNNAEWNKILCHSKCNKAKRYNADYQINAGQKIKENQRRVFVPRLEDKSDNNASPEINHNIVTRNLIKQKLTEVITIDGRIEYKEALNGLTFLIQEKIEHCSQITVRRHLDALTSSFPGFEAPFMVERQEDGKKYIVRRSGN